MAHLIANIKQKFIDSNGDPLVGGKLYSYEAGTSTPLVTYQNKDESTQNTNPIILDANGEASIWVGANAYKFVLKDSLDNIQWTVDNVTFLNDSSVITAKIANSAVTTAKIANSNVTTAKILDANVTTAKIADSNVTTAKIADSNVTTAKIADSNVTTAKIADSNVTTGKIADSAVTTAKINNSAVTIPKLSTSNYTLSSSSGTFDHTTTSYAAVTNLSCAITTNGRPIEIKLIPDGSTTGTDIHAYTGSDSFLRFKRDTTVIASFQIPMDIDFPPSIFSYFDVPAAGTYTYTVEVAGNGAMGSVGVYGVKLLVREVL